MSPVARRLAELFVAPPTESRPPARATSTAGVPVGRPTVDGPADETREPERPSALSAPRLVLLGGQEARRVAPQVAAAVARARGGSCALVCCWAPPGVPPLPATARPALPAATRLAARLARRGHAAAPRGRVVVVALAEGSETAARAEVERAAVAAGDVPVILALAGPRGPGWDGLLGTFDVAVLAVPAAAGGELATVAAAALAATCPRLPTHVLPVPTAATPLHRLPRAAVRALVELVP